MFKKLKVIGFVCTLLVGFHFVQAPKARAVAGVALVAGYPATAKTIATVAGVVSGSLLGIDLLWMGLSAVMGNSDGVLGGIYYLVIPAGVGLIIILDQETGIPMIGDLDSVQGSKLHISDSELDAFNRELPVVNAIIQETFFDVSENKYTSEDQLKMHVNDLFQSEVSPESMSILKKMFSVKSI